MNFPAMCSFSNIVPVRTEELILSAFDELTFSDTIPVRAKELICSSLDELTFSNTEELTF